MPVSTVASESLIRSISRSVSGLWSSCPSAIFCATSRSTSSRMRVGVGSCSTRAADSTESASIRMAVSFDCGLGPG